MAQGFHVIPAHSVTALAEAFAAQIKHRENPLHPETILVMNYAQRVWLQRFLAERFGICANLRFMSPERFLESLVKKTENPVFERNALAWRIFEHHKQALPNSAQARKDTEIFRRAHDIGNLFWRYQSFRTQMIRDWISDSEKFPETADPEFRAEYRRQKKLWREIMPTNEDAPAEAWLKLLESNEPIKNLPPRIFAFAPSALPHLHLRLLEKLAESSNVFLYYHHLSHDLWTETEESKTLLRRGQHPQKRKHEGNDELFPIRGNELLTAWGKAARPLAMHLIDTGRLDAESAIDTPPERDSLLHSLQCDLRDNAEAPSPYVPEKSDRSLIINIAPSPMREMEILREELTARFAGDPNLRPRDVLVTLADLETYTPFIRAAFENSGIPYSIADRSGTELYPAVSAFLSILDTAKGEMRINDVLALLDLEPIRLGLKLDETEIPPLRALLADAAIRWGIDTPFRARSVFGESEIVDEKRPLAQKFAENNSWKFGLQRLALGYMCGIESGDEPAPVSDEKTFPPVPDLTEEAHRALEKFSGLIEILAEINNGFFSDEEKSVPAWCTFLQEKLADAVFSDDESGGDIIRQKLAEIAFAAERGKLGNNPVSCTLETVHAALKMQDWGNSSRSDGMLRGKVTFCRMQPMRNIPAKIICIAGLNDGAFPRSGTPNSADLMAFRGKNFPPEITLWDRTARDDDNLLFLESILAAQEALLLSYVGRNANDGQAIPPCVPLAKLRDFVRKIAGDSGDTSAFEIRHRLYGFSPDYFSKSDSNGERYFSFNRTDFATAQGPGTRTHNSALGKKLFNFSEFPKTLSQKKFSDFFKAPAKFICENCVGTAPDFSAEKIENGDPPTKFSSLTSAQLSRELTKKIIYGNRNASLEAEAETLYARELDSGKISAFSDRDSVLDHFLNKQFLVREALEETLPENIAPIPETELPSEPVLGEIRIRPDFRNLFRDAGGKLHLFLFGKKNFDWRAAVETFVAAQLLRFAFPQKEFTAYYFAYGNKKAVAITKASLSQSEISAETLAEFYLKSMTEPPFLFETLPSVSFGKNATTPESFFAAVQKNYTPTPCETFVFGEAAPDSLKDEITNEVFPFVRDLYATLLSL